MVLSRIFKYLSCIFATLLLFPFGKWCVPSFHWLEFPSFKETSCMYQVCLKYWSWNRLTYFRYFAVITSWKRAWSFIWKNFTPFIQGCFLPSLAEIGPVLLRRFLNIVYAFLVFCYYLENSVAFQLNRLEFPSSF